MMVSRFGNGLPIDSNVLRPITTTLPVVSCLNHLKSSGKCHGILLPAPITRLSDIAAIALKCFIALRLASDSPFVNRGVATRSAGFIPLQCDSEQVTGNSNALFDGKLKRRERRAPDRVRYHAPMRFCQETYPCPLLTLG